MSNRYARTSPRFLLTTYRNSSENESDDRGLAVPSAAHPRQFSKGTDFLGKDWFSRNEDLLRADAGECTELERQGQTYSAEEAHHLGRTSRRTHAPNAIYVRCADACLAHAKALVTPASVI